MNNIMSINKEENLNVYDSLLSDKCPLYKNKTKKQIKETKKYIRELRENFLRLVD